MILPYSYRITFNKYEGKYRVEARENLLYFFRYIYLRGEDTFPHILATVLGIIALPLLVYFMIDIFKYKAIYFKENNKYTSPQVDNPLDCAKLIEKHKQLHPSKAEDCWTPYVEDIGK